MNDRILSQLLELARAFDRVGLTPLICRGLGVFLSLCGRQKEVPLRMTNDIDLMLTQQQLSEEANRNAIAEIITGTLDYRARELGKYFMFEKDDGQRLDILTQPIYGLAVDGFRAKIVPSRLHAYITEEALFVEEDMKTIRLCDLLPGNKEAEELAIRVPSLTNFLVLKLFAFDDRDSGPRRDDNQARAHAFDVYVLVTLATQQDYETGSRFLARHSDSDVIRRAKEIVNNKFSSVDAAGWRRVLEAPSFYSNLRMEWKKQKLNEAKGRLIRCFA